MAFVLAHALQLASTSLLTFTLSLLTRPSPPPLVASCPRPHPSFQALGNLFIARPDLAVDVPQVGEGRQREWAYRGGGRDTSPCGEYKGGCAEWVMAVVGQRLVLRLPLMHEALANCERLIAALTLLSCCSLQTICRCSCMLAPYAPTG